MPTFVHKGGCPKICARGSWIPPKVQSIENELMMQLFRTRDDDLTPHTGTEVQKMSTTIFKYGNPERVPSCFFFVFIFIL